MAAKLRCPDPDHDKSSAGKPPGRENQMKLVKLTMLAATAAVVAMAFIGASSASATPPWISICLSQVGGEPLLNCTNRVKHPLPGRLIILVGPGSFKAGFVNIECPKGEGHTNQVESQQNLEFKATLEELTFTGCKGCTGVAVATPQPATLKMTTETGGWVLESSNAKVKFTGCSLSQECTYEGNLSLAVQMNEKGVFIEPKGAAFKRVAPSTSLCAETGKWESGTATAHWELDDFAYPNGTRHENIFVSLIGKELLKTP